jgi:hypothetical protein
VRRGEERREAFSHISPPTSVASEREMVMAESGEIISRRAYTAAKQTFTIHCNAYNRFAIMIIKSHSTI